MSNRIIAISREFGSGGRIIGDQLARRLRIPFYDRTIIEEAAKSTGLSAAFIEEEEQRFTNSFLFNLSMGNHTVTASGVDLQSQVFKAESNIITSLADKGSCVIVGRCADYILRERKNLLSAFICGDFDWRVKRAIDEYGLPAEKAAKTVRSRDKQRARHYHFYTDGTWGNREHYDLILNSSRLGMDTCVELLAQLAQ